jgi:pilus assembly protein CpaE
MTDITTILFEPDLAIATALKVACPADTGVVDTWPSASPGRGTTVICGPTVDLPAILRFATEFVAADGTGAIIVVRKRVDITLLTSAIRAGVSDVVLDNDLVELGRAIARARRRIAQIKSPRSRAHITTVCAAKGGVGKTTLATTLALLLTARGHRTAVVDLDLEFGDVTTTLNLTPSGNAAHIDLTNGDDHVDFDMISSQLTEHSSGLHVLAAPPEPSAASGLSAEYIGQILDVMAGEFDHVVVDTPPSLNEHVLAAIDRSQTVAMLTTLDVPALRNARTAISTLQSIGVNEQQLRLIVNRSDAETGVRLSEVSQALNYPVEVAIPSSRDVPASVNSGTFFAQTSLSHPVCVAVAVLADLVAANPSDDMAPDSTPVRRLVQSPRTSRWGRLLALRGAQ